MSNLTPISDPEENSAPIPEPFPYWVLVVVIPSNLVPVASNPDPVASYPSPFASNPVPLASNPRSDRNFLYLPIFIF